MTFTHSVFGLSIQSNVPIPGLPVAESPPNSTDVQLFLGFAPRANEGLSSGSEVLKYTSPFQDELGEPAVRVWNVDKGSFFHLVYSDGPQFWLDSERKRLWALWPHTSSLEDAVCYLLGPVLGILLRHRGVTCLHASAIAVDGHAVAFVGPEGIGKSTTAAALARRGYAVLSDDVVALEEKQGVFYVQPAYPHLCLWPESVKLIYGSAEALPRFVPNWEKRRMPLGDDDVRFENRVLPLGGIYILDERRVVAPYIEPMGAQGAFVSLVANTYATDFLDREMRAREFGVLGRLVSNMPVHRLYARQEPLHLSGLCDSICKHFRDRKEEGPSFVGNPTSRSVLDQPTDWRGAA